MLIAVLFIIATKDNPFIHSNMKTIQKERSEKVNDLLRNFILVGASIMLLLDRGDRKTIYVSK